MTDILPKETKKENLPRADEPLAAKGAMDQNLSLLYMSALLPGHNVN